MRREEEKKRRAECAVMSVGRLLQTILKMIVASLSRQGCTTVIDSISHSGRIKQSAAPGAFIKQFYSRITLVKLHSGIWMFHHRS